jgi:hypothetical protein
MSSIIMTRHRRQSPLRDSMYHPNTVPKFWDNKDIAFPKENDKKVSAMQQLTDAHLFFPKALAYNVEK